MVPAIVRSRVSIALCHKREGCTTVWDGVSQGASLWASEKAVEGVVITKADFTTVIGSDHDSPPDRAAAVRCRSVVYGSSKSLEALRTQGISL